jgi:valyl-tRNA synthetase
VFCDHFIEVAKADFAPGADPERRAGTLATIDYTLRRVLQLLHPFAPFVTEELWHGLGFGTTTIQFSGWPEADGKCDTAALRFAHDFYEAVSTARNLRAGYNLPSNKKLAWLLSDPAPGVEEELAPLAVLLNASSLELHTGAVPRGVAVAITPIGKILLPLQGIVDIAAERARLEAEVIKVEAEIAKVALKLGNENFVNNAPADVVEEHRKRQKDWQQRLSTLLAALKVFE